MYLHKDRNTIYTLAVEYMISVINTDTVDYVIIFSDVDLTTEIARLNVAPLNF